MEKEALGGTCLNWGCIPTKSLLRNAEVIHLLSRGRELGHEVITAICPFAGNGKAVAMDDNSGFVKIVAKAISKRILGVHLIGGHVTELAAGATGIIALGATAEQLADTVHPHPTLSEALMEAAQALCGRAIHI